MLARFRKERNGCLKHTSGGILLQPEQEIDTECLIRLSTLCNGDSHPGYFMRCLVRRTSGQGMDFYYKFIEGENNYGNCKRNG